MVDALLGLVEDILLVYSSLGLRGEGWGFMDVLWDLVEVPRF